MGSATYKSAVIRRIHFKPTAKGSEMKKHLLLVPVALCLFAGVALAEEVRDWHDLRNVHVKVQQSIKEMERARAANHYDMAGHGAKAEELLRQAEHELKEAVEAAKHAK
jgi:hypothetical protein